MTPCNFEHDCVVNYRQKKAVMKATERPGRLAWIVHVDGSCGFVGQFRRPAAITQTASSLLLTLTDSHQND